LAWELWALAGYDLKAAVSHWRQWLALSLIPLTYIFWIAYRIVILGDGRPDFNSLSSFFYSTLLSPASHLVVRDLGFTWPWKAAYLAIQRALTLSFVNPWIDLIFGFLFLALIILAWSRMRTSYRIYVALIAVVSFSFHTGMAPTGGAYLSLPRHLLLAFPVFIGLGTRWHGLSPWLLIATGTAAMTFLLFGYLWIHLVP